MEAEKVSIAVHPAWEAMMRRAQGRVWMVVGGPGTGKTSFSHYLVNRLAALLGPVALLSADVGQTVVGVPTCMGVSWAEPRERASALWFVGDITPQGNMLPTVVGAGQLVARAMKHGAQAVVLDTSGLVDGPLGRVLKYHKALATRAEQIVAIEREDELDPMLRLLGGTGAEIHRLAPVVQARQRQMAERRQHRLQLFREHFHGGQLYEFDAYRLVERDWTPGRIPGRPGPPLGSVLGLIDPQGFCLGLGLVEAVLPDRVIVYTTWSQPEAVAHLQVGRLRLDRAHDFAETR